MFSKLFENIYEKANGPLKQALYSSITKEADEKRIRYAKQIAEVKTIWQIDKNVNIMEFYHPTRIDFGGQVRRIDKASDLLNSPSVIVEGIAGQGKSIFMRFLCMSCIKDKSYLPIFIQLRHISSEISLVDLILEAFSSIGIVNDKLVIEYFLRRGKLVFLLDGFDEIDAELRSATIRTIEEYRHNYKNIKIVVSSRPNSDIQHSTIFEVTRIKVLNHDDRKALINRLVDDVATKDMLLAALEGKCKIEDVLITPLLVTLLIITYKSESEIPENLSEFYRSLFNTLLKRHDKTKPGYKRQRKTEIGNVEFERVFENLCFSSLNNYKLSLSECELHDFCKSALMAQNIDNVKPESYMHDLVNITCLLLLDGTKYYYLHKSIPEYFAAQKIAGDKNTTHKALFYEQLRNNEIPENWYQSIYFLSEIDEYNYVKELLLPYYYRTFRLSKNDVFERTPTLTEDHVMEIVGELAELRIHHVGNENYAVRLQLDTANWLVNTFLRQQLEDTFGRFINNLSELILDPLIRSNKSSGLISYCFKEANVWPAFLTYVNADSPLRQCYSQIITLLKKIEAQEVRARPLFNLKL